jgi:hypothetical protein
MKIVDKNVDMRCKIFIIQFIVCSTLYFSYKTFPSDMKNWPYKRDGLSWSGQFSTNVVFYYLSGSKIQPDYYLEE